jgi:hypothetical protein
MDPPEDGHGNGPHLVRLGTDVVGVVGCTRDPASTAWVAGGDGVVAVVVGAVEVVVGAVELVVGTRALGFVVERSVTGPGRLVVGEAVSPTPLAAAATPPTSTATATIPAATPARRADQRRPPTGSTPFVASSPPAMPLPMSASVRARSPAPAPSSRPSAEPIGRPGPSPVPVIGGGSYRRAESHHLRRTDGQVSTRS